MFWRVLPTSFGKSSIYQIIPMVLERLRNGRGDTTSIICVVSPLEYIGKQQVANITTLNCGIWAAAIGEDDDMDKEIEQEVFISCLAVQNSGSAIGGRKLYSSGVCTAPTSWW